MARTIAEIKEAIRLNVDEQIPSLSTSKTAEWSLWVYIVAVAIHAFELVLDLFKLEINGLTNRITPGTVRWYAEMCKRFQNGDSLEFDEETALLYYPVEDPGKQIIEVAAVSEGKDDSNHLFIKVAKKDAQGKIVELSSDELYNFTSYIDAIKFAGCQTEIISTKADQIQYHLTVYHDPAIPGDTIMADVPAALEAFKTSIDFDGILYRQKFLDAVMDVDGIVTCVLEDFCRHSYQSESDEDWDDIDTHTELDAGYFEYADGSVDGRQCVIDVKSINDLINKNQ